MLSWLVAVVLGTRAALLRRLDLSKLSSDNFGLAYAVSQSPRASPAVVVAHTSLGTTAPASATLLVPGPDRLPAGPLAAMATAVGVDALTPDHFTRAGALHDRRLDARRGPPRV
ncbi:hypothetical protein F1559_001442 [Cyanidiococcus yangmingshanensis]|uniref:Uncharacterized protein n=1 Tax=Cyanidiococcus yangmingshanensis TaxID=2690220 RepID=A0A7J7IR02_9RHOD|nr:hypothetical protein F1559_001442 [Cyanidiococcus yangmingshanensis]